MNPSSLVALLRERANTQPAQVGYVHLVDGETEEDIRTWAALDLRARAVATWLQHRQARGERVLILLDEGNAFLDALFGCFYAGALAVPVHPPDPARLERTLPRLLAICANAGIRFVVSTTALGRAARPHLDAADTVLADAQWLHIDQLNSTAAEGWVDPGIGPEDLAYLQYTSGSTATPKGVMISHRNLLHQLVDFDTGYGHEPGGTLVSWLPATHDLGLVYGRLMALHVGMRCVYMSPAAFMHKPIRWLEALHRYRGTHTPSPNFGFEVVIRKTTEVERSHLDLSCVRVVLNGAEPIRQASEQLFSRALAPVGLRPTAVTHAMGMSESTAKIVTEPIDRAPPRFVHLEPTAYEANRVVLVQADHPGARTVASCGRTVLDTRVQIVDPQTREALGSDRVGELWVAGTTVAQGYWANPDATAATFHAHTRDGDGPFLRTGDLAFVHEGEVFLTGRLKDLVIVRGQNHHPQDIEWSLSHLDALRPNCAAAFGITSQGRESLGVVTEVYPDRVPDPEAVFGAMRRAIFEGHGLKPTVLALLPPRALPKTSSGKIQRTRARQMLLRGELSPMARWDASAAQEAAPALDIRSRIDGVAPRRRRALLLEFMAERAARLLGLDPDDIEYDRALSELGLDSVTAVELVEQVSTALGKPADGTVLFDHPTLNALATHLTESGAPEPPPNAWLADKKARGDLSSMSEEEAAAALLRELEDL